MSEYYLGHNLDLFYLLYQTFLSDEGIYKRHILPKRWVESIKPGRSSVRRHLPSCIWGHHHQLDYLTRPKKTSWAPIYHLPSTNFIEDNIWISFTSCVVFGAIFGFCHVFTLREFCGAIFDLSTIWVLLRTIFGSLLPPAYYWGQHLDFVYPPSTLCAVSASNLENTALWWMYNAKSSGRPISETKSCSKLYTSCSNLKFDSIILYLAIF